MPEPTDPTAPTHRVDPVAPTTGAAPPTAPSRTHWVTAIFRPGRDHTRVLGNGADRSAGRTAVLDPRGSAAGGGDRRPGLGRRVARPLAEWSRRLASRAVVGPASELDYSVPAELRRSYTVLGHIGSGGEAVVYLAEPGAAAGTASATSTSNGAGTRRVALKLYRPGHDINRELLDRLRARSDSSPHTPAIHGYGHARSSWGEELAWEAQEFFEHGSLRALLDEAPLPEQRARDIVAAVAACLRYWQDTLQHNHTDVKPENLLVRRVDPPVFALTDFGGAVRATMSRVYGGLAITEDYAAPEVVEGRRESPAAWWSLGIMVHEMMTGRRPERGDNWLTARQSEVDVSAIPDERWRLLARGLLIPSPGERWGYAQVNQWLAGETPQVARARQHAPLRFAGVDHDDPPSLAFDLLDRSDKGEVWLRAHWRGLRTWLDREVNDYTFDRSYLTQLDQHPERAQVAISALAAHFVPGMPPRYRGHEVTAEGVLALATGDRSRQAVLREAVELGALGLAARHWCDHPSCRAGGTNRCALLERVQHEVPLIMTQVRANVDRLAASTPTGSPVTRPADHEWDTAWAHATELILDREAPRRYRRMLRSLSWRPGQHSAAARAPWWAEQRRAAARGAAGEVTTGAALVTAMLLLPTAAQAGALERDRQRTEARQRRRERWERGRSGAAERWAAARDRLRGENGAETPDRRALGDRLPWRGDPADPAARAREERRRLAEQRRVDRGLQQIERARGAGRCRRFAMPLAWLGLLDGLGTLLLFTVGLSYTTEWIATTDTAMTAFSQSFLVAPIAALTTGLLGLLPWEIGHAWWFAVLLAVLLWLCCRYAKNQQRAARPRLTAYRLAVAGSVVMAVRLLASGLLMATMGVLIPLSYLY